jgi:hypothetical protein
MPPDPRTPTVALRARCPAVGDVVLYRMPDGWEPDQWQRIWPALVVSVANPTTHNVDLTVFVGDGDTVGRANVPRGLGEGCWTRRDGDHPK